MSIQVCPGASQPRPFAVRRAGAAAVLLVVLAYGVLAFVVLSPSNVYSTDVGVKYVQAESLIHHRFRSLDLDYPAAKFDRERLALPFRAPYVLAAGGEVQAIWNGCTAIFNALSVAWLGYPGMIVASLLGAAVVLFAAWRLSNTPWSAAVPVLLGLATPLWFFGTIGWEHVPAIAFSTLAWLVAARAGTPARALLAGLLLGVGATLREEVVLLAPGLLVLLWLRTRNWRTLLAAAVAVVVPLIAAIAIDSWWFGRPAAVHALYSAQALRKLLHLPEVGAAGVEPLPFGARYSTVVRFWLFGYDDNRLILLSAAALAAVAIVRARWRIGVPLLVMIGLLAGLAGIDAWQLARTPRWLAGMYRLSPFLVFAVLPAPPGTGRRTIVATSAVWALVAYLALALLGADLVGGKGFPRLLLPLVPLLVVGAWEQIVSHLRAPARVDRWTGRFGLVLVALSLIVHLAGTIPAYADYSDQNQALVEFVDHASERVVIADDPATAATLLPLYYRKTILLCDSPELIAALGSLLDGGHVPGVLLISRDEQPGLLPGYGGRRAFGNGRAVVWAWRRLPSHRAAPVRPQPKRVVLDLIAQWASAERRPKADVFSLVNATIAGRTRPAILISEQPGSRAIWRAKIPDSAWLEVGAGLLESSWHTDGDGVQFTVRVWTEGSEERSFLVNVNPFANENDREWKDIAVDLSPYAGRVARITLSTRSGVPLHDNRNGDQAVWGEPRIVVR